MITTAQDYLWVTFDAGLKINGDIQPLRQGAAKDEWRALDIGFLLEAAAERLAAVQGSYNNTFAVDKRILASRYAQVVSLLSACRSNYVRSVPPLTVADLNQDVAFEDDFGIKLAGRDFKASAANFVRGGSILSDDTANLYYDVHLMRRFRRAGSQGSWTYSSSGSYTIAPPTNYSGSGMIYYSAYHTDSTNGNSERTFTVAGGSLEVTPNNLTLVDSAAVFLAVLVSWPTMQTRRLYVPVVGVKTATGFSVSAASLNSAAASAIQYCAAANSYHDHNGRTNLLSVEVESVTTIYTLTDRTNW